MGRMLYLRTVVETDVAEDRRRKGRRGCVELMKSRRMSGRRRQWILYLFLAAEVSCRSWCVAYDRLHLKTEAHGVT